MKARRLQGQLSPADALQDSFSIAESGPWLQGLQKSNLGQPRTLKIFNEARDWIRIQAVHFPRSPLQALFLACAGASWLLCLLWPDQRGMTSWLEGAIIHTTSAWLSPRRNEQVPEMNHSITNFDLGLGCWESSFASRVCALLFLPWKHVKAGSICFSFFVPPAQLSSSLSI